jgi:translation initiation factor 2A
VALYRHAPRGTVGRRVIPGTYAILIQFDHGELTGTHQAQWRPLPPQDVPPFPQAIPPVPQPAEPALATPEKAAVKPAGAYRPPGARGQAASSVYKREDEGGSGPSTPIPTPPHRGSYHGRGNGRDSPGPSTNGRGGYPGRGRGGGPRHVPGAPPPQQSPGVGLENGEKITRRKKVRDKKKGGKDGAEDGPEDGGEEPTSGPATPGVNGAFSSAPASTVAAPEATAAEGGLDPLQKKIRNLTKKVRFRPPAGVWLYAEDY